MTKISFSPIYYPRDLVGLERGFGRLGREIEALLDVAPVQSPWQSLVRCSRGLRRCLPGATCPGSWEFGEDKNEPSGPGILAVALGFGAGTKLAMNGFFFGGGVCGAKVTLDYKHSLGVWGTCGTPPACVHTCTYILYIHVVLHVCTHMLGSQRQGRLQGGPSPGERWKMRMVPVIKHALKIDGILVPSPRARAWE